MARTRGPSCAEPARRSSRLATKTTQAPKPLNTARGGPSTRGGRHAHVTQRKVSNCASGVDRQPHSTLSPSQSSLFCPPTSPSASSPSRRPLPVPSCLPPTRDQPSSRASSPATVTSPVATVPLQPLPRRVSTPYSRPAFLLPSPPLSPLLPSPFKSSLLLCVFLTLVIPRVNNEQFIIYSWLFSCRFLLCNSSSSSCLSLVFTVFFVISATFSLSSCLCSFRSLTINVLSLLSFAYLATKQGLRLLKL